MNQQEDFDIDSAKMLGTAQKTKGYLLKKATSLLGGWQRRYFLILNHALIYYPDQTLQKKKGSIQLGDITKIVMHQENQFSLETKKRTYEFKCENQKQRNLWVASLNLLKQSADFSPVKKYLTRSKREQKNIEESKSLAELSKQLAIVFQLMKLSHLYKQRQTSKIYNRVIWKAININQFYISVSIKSLVFPELDQQLLPIKFIQPYEFNKLYHVTEQKVTEICKMSLIQSLKAEAKGISILAPERKQIKIPLKNESEAHQMSLKIVRCCQVAKQYYNPYNIILKKNIDRLIWMFDSHKNHFQEQIKYKITNYFNRYKNQPHEPVTVFISQFHSLKKNLIQIQQACKVSVTPCENMKAHYFRITHRITNGCLSQAWQYLNQLFQPQQLLELASQIYEYWVIINDVISDNKIIEACSDLTHYFLRKKGQQIKTQIQSIHFSKVQVKRVKNQLISNQITNTFYEWLIELLSNLGETAPLQRIFQDFCKFFIKAFEQLTDFIGTIIEKWNQIVYLIGICNDLSKIKKIFLSKAASQLCQGIIPQSRFIIQCSNYVAIKLDQAMANCIKRIFIIVFSSIDKKILNKTFLELDIGKICFEVLQRLEPVKKKVDQFVQNQIIMLSFDEICFFFFTCLLKRKVLVVKNSQQTYAKAIQKGVIQIQQYYCNIQTQIKVKKHLQEILYLKDVLVCSDILIQKYCKQLRKFIGLAFNEECISNILKIRQTPQEKKSDIYNECCETIKMCSSEQDTSSRVQSDIYQSRPRTSTLTQSGFLNPNNKFQTQLVSYIKQGVQGFLNCRKVQKKGIPSFSVESYYKISNCKIEQINGKGSNQIISFIDLNKMEKCYLQNLKHNTFIIEFKNCKYYFQASSRDIAGKWVQAIYAETNHPMFQNKMVNRSKKQQSQQCLFKDFDNDPTTTDTLKKKWTDQLEYQNQVLEQKRVRRIKQVHKSPTRKHQVSPLKKVNSKIETKNNNSKQPKKIQKKKSQEGSCCSKGFF